MISGHLIRVQVSIKAELIGTHYLDGDMEKRILITGVSKGLGLALTELFIQSGHTVLGCARSPEAIHHLQSKFGAPHNFAMVDVSDPVQVQLWCDRLFEQSELPDLVINNAGIMNQPAPLWEISEADFSQLIDINIKGVVNVIRAIVPKLLPNQQGIIVNLSSGWGRSASPGVGPYCASKWAIEGLTRSLAQELPQGMAAIALNPGIIHTEMLDTCFGTSATAYESPTVWAKKAVPFLLGLTASDNGKPLTVPN